MEESNPNPTSDWMVKLPHMAKEMEKELYRVAETREVYSDLSTLRERLRQVATTLGSDDVEQQRQRTRRDTYRRSRNVGLAAPQNPGNVRPREEEQSRNVRNVRRRIALPSEETITIHVRIVPDDILGAIFGGGSGNIHEFVHHHLRMLGPLLGGHGNIQEFLNYLMENDPNRHGAPPASATVVENLPLLTITDDHVSRKDECSVCRDVFTVGAQVKEMPCKHLFCPSCIEPWLKEHNSCPNCRDELPTDDVDYEERKRERVI